MTNYIINFLNRYEAEIDAENWNKVFSRCNPNYVPELKACLKQANIQFKIDPIDTTKSYMPIDQASKFVQKLVKDLGITARQKYNDKGKTGRKLKWEYMHVPSSINDLEETIAVELDKHNILYEYVSVIGNLKTINSTLYIRLADPEVYKK